MVYGRYNYSNYSIHGVFVNQHSHHYGAPPALGIPDFHEMSSNANVFFSVQPKGIPFSSTFGCLDFFIYTYGKLYLCSNCGIMSKSLFFRSQTYIA